MANRKLTIFACRNHNPVLSSSVTFSGFVMGVTRRVSLVEQELLTHPEYLSSTPGLWVSVVQSLVFCEAFVLLSFFFWPLHCLAHRFTASVYPCDIFKLLLNMVVLMIDVIINSEIPVSFVPNWSLYRFTCIIYNLL